MPSYIREDARVWAHWNHSSDMHLNSLGPISCFCPFWIPLGCTVGTAAAADCLLAGNILCLLKWQTTVFFFVHMDDKDIIWPWLTYTTDNFQKWKIWWEFITRKLPLRSYIWLFLCHAKQSRRPLPPPPAEKVLDKVNLRCLCLFLKKTVNTISNF